VAPSGARQIVLASEANRGFGDDDIEAVCKASDTADPGSPLVVDYEISPRAASQAVRAAHHRGVGVVIAIRPAMRSRVCWPSPGSKARKGRLAAGIDRHDAVDESHLRAQRPTAPIMLAG
jgi:hypothetical protein